MNTTAESNPTTGPWLVVGLGNPGDQYAGTRHNIGHMVVDELASRHGERWSRHKAGAAVVETRLRPGAPKIVLAKPASYMNLSGKPVSALVRFFSLTPEHLIVVHDELDIDFDTIRLKRGGGEGGHNGLKSISQSLGTRDYVRVRAGIGRPPGRMDVADYVLRPFGTTERKELPLHLDRCADAVESLIEDGMAAAQNRFH
ncbi:aminoacyl-tRNA hydrolase [Citricoccus muralis]|uniref:Peptidyl-tRNA hydrolase n=1 Tax=Citricoccus muralis TaxID=169134 RepID=A0ABY8H9U3_9MICC|nr:aminoacyl-tRNA hydrolase [Citricoccus muralis]WFP17443.1 aminoacyl-tRNA hydrolase [Citricoccus muralis]